jgi:hypothetical protein
VRGGRCGAIRAHRDQQGGQYENEFPHVDFVPASLGTSRAITGSLPASEPGSRVHPPFLAPWA